MEIITISNVKSAHDLSALLNAANSTDSILSAAAADRIRDLIDAANRASLYSLFESAFKSDDCISVFRTMETTLMRFTGSLLKHTKSGYSIIKDISLPYTYSIVNNMYREYKGTRNADGTISLSDTAHLSRDTAEEVSARAAGLLFSLAERKAEQVNAKEITYDVQGNSMPAKAMEAPRRAAKAKYKYAQVFKGISTRRAGFGAEEKCDYSSHSNTAVLRQIIALADAIFPADGWKCQLFTRDITLISDEAMRCRHFVYNDKATGSLINAVVELVILEKTGNAPAFKSSFTK